MSSPALVGKLNGPKMMEVGITDKDQKRAITNAIRGLKLAGKGTGDAQGASSNKKRKRDDGDLLNPLIPGDPSLRRGKQAVEYDVSDFDFKEVHDIEVSRALFFKQALLIRLETGDPGADISDQSCAVHDRMGIHNLRKDGLRPLGGVESRLAHCHHLRQVPLTPSFSVHVHLHNLNKTCPCAR